MEVEKGWNNSRHLSAGVDIAAPVSVVWNALTDYDNLNTFIPGMISPLTLQSLLQKHAARRSVNSRTAHMCLVTWLLLHKRFLGLFMNGSFINGSHILAAFKGSCTGK